MQIQKYLHAAVLVSDLERAEQFYSQVLGLARCDRNLNFPGIWYQVGDKQVHLMQNDRFAAPLFNEQKWGRNAHIAFSVADLDAAKAKLLAHDCEVQMSSSGRAALFTRDPDGNIIELQQG
jgi:catechol 2,3-dioxygenase-like lactoylglutathione lyase family enzyme